MRSDVYFLPPRTSVTDSVGISTLPIFSCSPNAATRDSSDSFTLRSNPEYEWMMYHFMFGLRGASPVAVTPSAPEVCSAVAATSFFGSSCMIKFKLRVLRVPSSAIVLFPEIAIQLVDAFLNHVVDHKKVHAKNEDRNYHNPGSGLLFFPLGRGDLAHFLAHFVVKRLGALWPGFQPVCKVSVGGRD